MPRATTAQQPTPVIINQSLGTESTEPKPAKPKKDFWTYISELSAQDWRTHLVYLYRIRPVVGTKQAERYLDKFAQNFTIEDVKERFGGEGFRVMLLKDNKTLMTEEFSIEAAPKFDASREIPSNETSQTALVRDLVEKVANRNDATSEITDAAMSKGINILSGAFETALTRIASANPGGGMTGMLEMIRVLKEFGLVGAPQRESLKDTIITLKELGLIGANAQPQNQIETFKGMLSMVKELAGEIGPDTAPANWKGRLVDKVMDAAPTLIGQVTSMFDKQAAIEREKTQRAQLIVNSRMPGATPPPAPASMASQAGPHQAAMPPETGPSEPMHTVHFDRSAAPPPPPAQSQVAGQPSQQWVSERVLNAIEAEQSGSAVIDFLDVTNPQVTEFFATQTAEQIKALFSQDPILVRALALPNFEEWLTEAVEYLHDEGEDGPANKKPN